MSAEMVVVLSRPAGFGQRSYESAGVPANWAVCLDGNERVFRIAIVHKDGRPRDIFRDDAAGQKRSVFFGPGAVERIGVVLDANGDL